MIYCRQSVIDADHDPVLRLFDSSLRMLIMIHCRSSVTDSDHDPVPRLVVLLLNTDSDLL